MKNITYFGLLAGFLTGYVQAGPLLSIENPIHDFGKVQGEPVIEHAFTLENKGDTPLVIRRIQVSCGCTTSGISSLKIDPGEQAEIPVRMDLKGRTGKQRQIITLHTNDPDRRQVPLSITGQVVPAIEITPRTLNLMHVDPENPKTGTVELRSTKQTPFQVTNVETVNDRIATNIIPSEDGTSAIIEVTPLAQTDKGHFSDILVIDTDDKRVQGKRVLVMWQVQSGVTVTPGSLNLIPVQSPTPQQRYFMVKPPPKQKEGFKVTGVEWPGREDVDIRITELPYGWRVHLKDLKPEEDMSGEHLIFRTNLEGYEELKISVKVLKR